MTLRDIENALPPVIRFVNDYVGQAAVLVHDTYMGMIYDTADGLYYNSQCAENCPDDVIRRDVFLSYFNYESVLSLRLRYFKWSDHYQLYKIEPKFRVVYK